VESFSLDTVKIQVEHAPGLFASASASIESEINSDPHLNQSDAPKLWTRRGLAESLCDELDRDIPTLVGIDHAFSFPLAYFEKYRLSSETCR
jgi:hypothetical protein